MSRRTRITCLSLCLILPVSVSVEAQTVGLGTNPIIILPSIQQAVDIALDGATIRMSEGTFFENVVVSNVDITMEGGYDATLWNRTGGETYIDGQGLNTTLWFIDSSSRVDRVNLVRGANLICGGGALLHRSWVEFNDCDLSTNGATFGGGLCVGLYSYAKMIGASRVFSNSAAWGGGGCFVDGRLDIVSEEADVFHNVVNDGGGGGVWVETGYLRLFQGDLYQNAANGGAFNPVSRGGGLGANGSFIEAGDSCLLWSNTAMKGGGVYLLNSTAYLGNASAIDVMVEENHADFGGGIYASNSQVHLRGVEVHLNESTFYGGGMAMDHSSLQCDTNLNRFLENYAGQDGGGLSMRSSTARLVAVTFGAPPFPGNKCGRNGGGIYGTASSSVLIEGGLFSENQATNGALQGRGGAIALETFSSLALSNGPGYLGQFTNVVLHANSAATNGTGGGIYMSQSSATLNETLLLENTAGYGGGADVNAGFLMLTNAEVRSNHGIFGAGGLYASGSTVPIIGSRLLDNRSGGDGGAISLGGGTTFIVDSQVVGNSASNHAGAISAYGGKLLIGSSELEPAYDPSEGWSTVFASNTAHWTGGAISMQHTTCEIIRVAFLQNASSFGSALSHAYSDVEIETSLFAENGDGSLGGHVLQITSSTGSIDRCTIVSNHIVNQLEATSSSLSISNTIIYGGFPLLTNGATLAVSHCNIKGGYPGASNIDAEPRLFPNFHLMNPSPCVGAGSVSGGGFDIDQEPRVGTTDIGFDEFADSDDDRLPDVIETGTGIYIGDVDTGSNPNDPQSDGDNVDDWSEWLADTDPNNSGDYLRFLLIADSGASNRLEWAGGTKAWQYVETASSATGTAWQSVFTNTPPTPVTNAMNLDTLGAIGDSSVFRIRAHR
ncbi:MAG: hypothetical protein KJ626_03265 [Verrucomicrobia bacterium]|nr:hypothetical protein [Verrucomicrobiota bacterium]